MNMKQKTLEEYIECLLPAAREKYSVLIQECIQRKKSIRDYTEKTCNSIEELSSNIKIINRRLADLEKCCKIHETLVDDFVYELMPMLKSLTNTNKPSRN